MFQPRLRVRRRAAEGDDVPAKQLVDAVDGLACDASQNLAEISLRVQTCELRRGNQTVDNGATLSSGIGTGSALDFDYDGGGGSRERRKRLAVHQ